MFSGGCHTPHALPIWYIFSILQHPTVFRATREIPLCRYMYRMRVQLIVSFYLNAQIKHEDAEPSKVLHIRNLPDSASEADVSLQCLMNVDEEPIAVDVESL
jgi:hypothetical protein